MYNNEEMRATLDAITARLDAEPRSVGEWDAIIAALDEINIYAHKTRSLYRLLVEREKK